MLKQLRWRDREAVCLVGRMERKRAKSSYRTRASPQIWVNSKGNKKKEIATCTNYLEIRCLKSKRTWKTVEKSFCQRMGKTEGRKQAKNCCLFFTSSVGQFDCLNYVHTKLWWTPKLKDEMKRIAERSRSHSMRSNAQWGDLICIRGHGELRGSRPKIHSETHHSVCVGGGCNLHKKSLYWRGCEPIRDFEQDPRDNFKRMNPASRGSWGVRGRDSSQNGISSVQVRLNKGLNFHDSKGYYSEAERVRERLKLTRNQVNTHQNNKILLYTDQDDDN